MINTLLQHQSFSLTATCCFHLYSLSIKSVPDFTKMTQNTEEFEEFTFVTMHRN